jgi:hypothetical protein
MGRVATLAAPFVIGFDSEPFSEGGTKDQAAALARWGARFFCGYLGSMTSARLDDVLAAGLAFMPVTYADRFDGIDTVKALQALGVPRLTTVWLDLEGISSLSPQEIIAKSNGWGTIVRSAGYDPGIYVGEGQQLSSAELGALTVDRYWHGCSELYDRNMEIASPFYSRPIGWSVVQLFPPNQTVAGVKVDIDVIQQDYKGRLPLWVEAA